LDASSGQAYIDFALSGLLPSALGVYTDTGGVVLLDYSGNSFDRTYGTITLDVTSSVTPEPSTFGLAGIALALAWHRRRRRPGPHIS
jgi:MYXO-CTERM domain-containing protein